MGNPSEKRRKPTGGKNSAGIGFGNQKRELPSRHDPQAFVQLATLEFEMKKKRRNWMQAMVRIPKMLLMKTPEETTKTSKQIKKNGSGEPSRNRLRVGITAVKGLDAPPRPCSQPVDRMAAAEGLKFRPFGTSPVRNGGRGRAPRGNFCRRRDVRQKRSGVGSAGDRRMTSEWVWGVQVRAFPGKRRRRKREGEMGRDKEEMLEWIRTHFKARDGRDELSLPEEAHPDVVPQRRRLRSDRCGQFVLRESHLVLLMLLMFTEQVRTESHYEGTLTKSQRLLLGLVVLLLVDVIWVSSSEITQYIYSNEKFDKPFFTTYFKTSLFSVYLLGLCFWPPWRDQCSNQQTYMYLDPQSEDDTYFIQQNTSLSDPQFVPIKRSDRSSGTESDDSSIHSVRFSKMAEVRHMSDADATEALLSRLSYQASIRAGEVARKSANKLPVNAVAKIALMFCFLWFTANYTYQVSLDKTETGVVTVLSSSSSLFTLLLTAGFPANTGDRFSLSKLVAVFISICGLVLVSLSDFTIEKKIPAGAFLAVVSALFYAAYLVFLRRRVENENKIDIPMFFGFVGLFNALLLWPFFFLLHYNRWESFEWPTRQQWMFLLLNGFIGTVLSEVLWLWGCFLTSSLIATVAISLTIPMAMFADIVFKEVNYPYLFYLGTVPMFFAFFAVTLLAHLENWDPIMDCIRMCYNVLCRRFGSVRLADDIEQTEALIGINDDRDA